MAADAVAALIDKQPLNIVRQHSDEFHQRQKLKGLPRWLSWMYQPSKSKAAMLVDPHQAVMIQAFDWDNMVFSKRSKLYSALADEMPKLAEAGVNIAWFPPPSSSADEHGYLPGKWCGVPPPTRDIQCRGHPTCRMQDPLVVWLRPPRRTHHARRWEVLKWGISTRRYDIPYKGDLMRAVRSAEAHGVVSMADVVLNHRTAAMLSNTTGDIPLISRTEGPKREWVASSSQLRPLRPFAPPKAVSWPKALASPPIVTMALSRRLDKL